MGAGESFPPCGPDDDTLESLGVKRMKSTAGFLFVLMLLIVLPGSCQLGSTITVAIYNNTSISSGTFHLIYGDYSGYADGDQYVTNPVFPYVADVNYSTKCGDYIVYATIETAAGESVGYIFFDTTSGGNFEGAINMTLSIVRGADAYEPDNNSGGASPIQAGEYQARSLTTAADVDYAFFYAAAGLRYQIETVIPSSESTDTVLHLYDSALNPIDNNHGGGSTVGGSLISYTPSTSGLCYIMVDGSASGPYGLSLGSYYSSASLESPLLKLNQWLER